MAVARLLKGVFQLLCDISCMMGAHFSFAIQYLDVCALERDAVIEAHMDESSGDESGL